MENAETNQNSQCPIEKKLSLLKEMKECVRRKNPSLIDEDLIYNPSEKAQAFLNLNGLHFDREQHKIVSL